MYFKCSPRKICQSGNKQTNDKAQNADMVKQFTKSSQLNPSIHFNKNKQDNNISIQASHTEKRESVLDLNESELSYKMYFKTSFKKNRESGYKQANDNTHKADSKSQQDMKSNPKNVYINNQQDDNISIQASQPEKHVSVLDLNKSELSYKMYFKNSSKKNRESKLKQVNDNTHGADLKKQFMIGGPNLKNNFMNYQQDDNISIQASHTEKREPVLDLNESELLYKMHFKNSCKKNRESGHKQANDNAHKADSKKQLMKSSPNEKNNSMNNQQDDNISIQASQAEKRVSVLDLSKCEMSYKVHFRNNKVKQKKSEMAEKAEGMHDSEKKQAKYRQGDRNQVNAHLDGDGISVQYSESNQRENVLNFGGVQRGDVINRKTGKSNHKGKTENVDKEGRTGQEQLRNNEINNIQTQKGKFNQINAHLDGDGFSVQYSELSQRENVLNFGGVQRGDAINRKTGKSNHKGKTENVDKEGRTGQEQLGNNEKNNQTQKGKFNQINDCDKLSIEQSQSNQYANTLDFGQNNIKPSGA